MSESRFFQPQVPLLGLNHVMEFGSERLTGPWTAARIGPELPIQAGLPASAPVAAKRAMRGSNSLWERRVSSLIQRCEQLVGVNECE
jgi:hypothetical protein